MPATRNNHHTRSSLVNSVRSKPPRDVIVISDDEDDTSHMRSRSRSRAPPPPIKQMANIIDVSSDEENITPLTRKNCEVLDLQRRIGKLEKEKLDWNITKTIMEMHVDDLMTQTQAQACNSLSVKASELEENLCCEICTMKMWSPYMLPDCGHTFCEACIKDWFGTILQKYMALHPGYNPNVVANLHSSHLARYCTDLFQQLDIHVSARQADAIAGILAGQNQNDHAKPIYTCPVCRKEAKHKPVESYAIKALVRVLAKAEGESSPRKAAPGGRRGKSVSRRAVAPGPWDGYFPPE